MGTVGLRKVRQNRVLLVTEDRRDAPNVVDQTINCAEGARATLGMDISDVLVLEKELFLQTGVSDSGRVTGRVERLGHLLDILREKRGTYDAVALATRITPHIDTVELHRIVVAESRRFPALGRLFYKSGPEACIAMLAAYLERHSSRKTLNLRNPRRTAEEFLELLRGYAHLRVLLGVQKTLSARELEENIEGAVQHILRAR
jgi:hypothetical protein